MRGASTAWLAASCFLFSGLAVAMPVPVSPGASDHAPIVATTCPTFSWTASSGASGYELIVYSAGRRSEDRDPVLRKRLPAATSSWTPSLDEALPAGRSLAWTVRTINAPAAEKVATPLLFATPATPSVDDVRHALEVLRAWEASGATRTPTPGRDDGRQDDHDTRPGAPVKSSDPVVDSVAVRGDNSDTTGEAIGVLGTTSSSDSAAGVVALANSTSGQAVGLYARSNSSQSSAALLEAPNGGKLLKGSGPTGEVFSVTANGALSAVTLAGSGASVTDVDAATLGGKNSGAFMPWDTDDWVNTTGDSMTGNLSTTGNFLWAVPRTFYKTLSAAAFASERDADTAGTTLSNYHFWVNSGTYIDVTPQSDSSQVSFVAPVELPDGATMTNVTLFAYDNDPTEDGNFTVGVGVHDLSSDVSSLVTFSFLTLSTTGSSASIQSSTQVTNPLKAVVNNHTHSYFVTVDLQVTGSGSPNVRFYGVQIAYTLVGPAN